MIDSKGGAFGFDCCLAAPAVIVNQSSSSAIINWNTFNIGTNESVRFNQPSSSSVALNRVTGGLGPSGNSRQPDRQRPHLPDIKNSDFMAGHARGIHYRARAEQDAVAVDHSFPALVTRLVRNSEAVD
jgi:hypothetical protein